MHTNLQRLYRGVKASASGGVVPAALEVSLPRVRDRSCRRRVRLFGRSVSGGGALTFHLGDLTDPFISSDFLVGTVFTAAGYAICHRCRPTGRGWARSLARDRATSKSCPSQITRSVSQLSSQEVPFPTSQNTSSPRGNRREIQVAFRYKLHEGLTRVYLWEDTN